MFGENVPKSPQEFPSGKMPKLPVGYGDAKPPRMVSEQDQQKIREASKRAAPGNEQAEELFFFMLKDLIEHRMLNVSHLEKIPTTVFKHPESKTRFDQLYDAAMNTAFPDYAEEIVQQMFGEREIQKEEKSTRLWRVILPAHHKIAHAFIRARSYQEAFAFACDYVCRASLLGFHVLPFDLTVRVQAVSEDEVREIYRLRTANNKVAARKKGFEHEKITDKQVGNSTKPHGVDPKTPEFALVKYLAARDMDNLKLRNVVRLSALDQETPISYHKRLGPQSVD